jgi:hypothetical protein
MRRTAIFVFVASTYATACGSPQSPPATSAPAAASSEAAATFAPRAACDELAKLCHSGESPVAQECHALSHSPTATAEQCAAKRASCVAACTSS